MTVHFHDWWVGLLIAMAWRSCAVITGALREGLKKLKEDPKNTISLNWSYAFIFSFWVLSLFWLTAFCYWIRS